MKLPPYSNVAEEKSLASWRLHPEKSSRKSCLSPCEGEDRMDPSAYPYRAVRADSCIFAVFITNNSTMCLDLSCAGELVGVSSVHKQQMG